MTVLGEFEEQYLRVRAEDPPKTGVYGARKAPPIYAIHPPDPEGIVP